MKLKADFNCQYCSEKTQVFFKKPAPLNPTIFSVTCKLCLSRFMLKFERKRKPTGPCYIMGQKTLFLSPVAKQIEEEKKTGGQNEEQGEHLLSESGTS